MWRYFNIVQAILRPFYFAIYKTHERNKKSKFEDVSASERYINDMKAGDIVKLKPDFEQELEKLGFCGHHAHAVSVGFNNGLLKIAYIRHEHEFEIDFAVFSPFFEVPVQCLELVTGKDLLKDYNMMKQNGLEK